VESLSLASLSLYWSAEQVAANILIFMNLLGALLLGLLVGYERTYHGRAAGMRTYGLVCMASAALTVISGYPEFWYGGNNAAISGSDPTRTIQGIVTGIGFLGAGMIMKEGMTISGLTTAASIWAASAIGIMVGMGFYAAAMLLALLSTACMMWVTKIENWLPSRQAVAVVLRFRRDFAPDKEILGRMALARGYALAEGSFSIRYEGGCAEWRFVAIALGRNLGASMTDLSKELTAFDGVENFTLSHARN
jgi:putative Mg2+ transporter-C (MgtC) family protein